MAISTYLLWKTYVRNIAENCACLVPNVWVGAQRAVGDLFASNEIMPYKELRLPQLVLPRIYLFILPDIQKSSLYIR